MAKVCQNCGKEPRSGNNRSHSNRATKRWFKPNIIVKNIDFNGMKLRVKICSRCYKKLQAQGAL